MNQQDNESRMTVVLDKLFTALNALLIITISGFASLGLCRPNIVAAWFGIA